MNKILLIGYLGQDPEMRYTSGGEWVTSFGVATSYGKGDAKQTQWFHCSAWDKQAELCNEYLRKGSQVYIEGRIRARCYEGKSGWVASLDVVVSNVQFLGSAPSESDATVPNEERIRAEAAEHIGAAVGAGAEDDLPF